MIRMTHVEKDKVPSEEHTRMYTAVNYIQYEPRVSADNLYNNLIKVQFISTFDWCLNYMLKEIHDNECDIMIDSFVQQVWRRIEDGKERDKGKQSLSIQQNHACLVFYQKYDKRLFLAWRDHPNAEYEINSGDALAVFCYKKPEKKNKAFQAVLNSSLKVE